MGFMFGKKTSTIVEKNKFGLKFRSRLYQMHYQDTDHLGILFLEQVNRTIFGALARHSVFSCPRIVPIYGSAATYKSGTEARRTLKSGHFRANSSDSGLSSLQNAIASTYRRTSFTHPPNRTSHSASFFLNFSTVSSTSQKDNVSTNSRL